MNNKQQLEKDYIENKIVDCPWCGKDKPRHYCENCYVEMTIDDCWKYEGFCSEKCLKYIKEELPKLRQEKADRGIKCQCDDPNCYKCISGDCKDDNCFTHPLLAKMLARKK